VKMQAPPINEMVGSNRLTPSFAPASAPRCNPGWNDSAATLAPPWEA
jgi:hypothetical protein